MDPAAPTGTRSCWYDAPLHLSRPGPESDSGCEVCVIGAGMAGMLCAHALTRRGADVVVVDAGAIGSGETGRTTAHLASAVDDRFDILERDLGLDASRIQAASHAAAIDHLERVASDEAIECEFERVDGYLFLPPGEDQFLLVREHRAAVRAGLTDVERLASTPGFESGPCLRFPRQAQFHPLLFLSGVARAIESVGARIHTGVRVQRVHDEAGLRVELEGGRSIAARRVIVATNTPITDLVAMHTKQEAYRTYALTARVPRGSVARGLYWDTSEQAGDVEGPYHYVRLASEHSRGSMQRDSSHELLIVGGGDHRTGGDESRREDRWAPLEAWARERWPMMQDIVHRWSGQVWEPLDHAAYIGAGAGGPDGVFTITGDSGMGMTHSAIAAIMLPELIEGRDHPWKVLYDPLRKPTSAPVSYAANAARMAARYADWLAPGAKIDDIPPGEGRVVRHGLKLVAVYRDEQGATHERSAVCTHLGCIVQWNNAEKSWDCPCHGSRFDAMGTCIGGPASRELHHEARDDQPPPRGK